jgi:Tol biopolymer transport system component
MKKTFSLILVLALGMVTEVANADFIFGEAMNLGPTVNASAHDLCPRISTDGLSLFFPSERSGGVGGRDVYVTTRATTGDPWGAPVNLGPTVNSPADDYSLSISADGLSLYFASKRAGGFGAYDIWVTKRATKNDPWGEPVNLGPTVNSSSDTYSMAISTDGLTLHFTSNRPGGSGGYDVYVTTRPTTSDAWSDPANLGPTVNSSSNEYTLGVSADGLSLYVVSDRGGGHGSLDIWLTRRTTTNDDWGAIVNLGPEVNSSAVDGFPGPSADGRTLFFSSNRPGGSGNVDLWQIPITPVVDFNGDGIVGSADASIMVHHWGTGESLCDIYPIPWGDGIVDVEDLKVLSEHFFEAVDDPTLIAHWPLDETEGMVVGDAAGENHAYALGGAVWQPDGGYVGGALLFDGVDDFVSAPAVLDPADGPFSVFLWLKGGAPGQAIISAVGGSNWLSLDPLTGSLMTELTSAGRGASFLLSQAVIHDESWHRIGFVWDGLYRTLLVDGVAVAEDTQDGLASPANGLYIGTGKDMAPGTYFSGLIDDVRIYNRVVNP